MHFFMFYNNFKSLIIKGELKIDPRDLICIEFIYDEGLFYLFGELYNEKRLNIN